MNAWISSFSLAVRSLLAAASVLRYFSHFSSLILFSLRTESWAPSFFELAAVWDEIKSCNEMHSGFDLCVWWGLAVLWSCCEVQTAFDSLTVNRAVPLFVNRWREMPGDCRHPKCLPVRRRSLRLSSQCWVTEVRGSSSPFLSGLSNTHTWVRMHTLTCIEVVCLLSLQVLSWKRPDKNPFWIFTMDRRQYMPSPLSPLPKLLPSLPATEEGGCQ